MSALDDPRVLFAAERTLLAWVRTGITAIGLGFLVARFDLFLRYVTPDHAPRTPAVALVIGVALVVVGALLCLLSTRQLRRLVQTLKPSEIPAGYSTVLSTGTGLAFGVLGVVLAAYLAREIFG
jgi:putative membrane protein